MPKIVEKIKKMNVTQELASQEKSTWGQSNAKMLKNQANKEAWKCSFCGDLVPKKELMTHLNYCLKAADLIMGIKCTTCHQNQFKSKHEVYGHILLGYEVKQDTTVPDTQFLNPFLSPVLETHDANVQFESISQYGNAELSVAIYSPSLH